MTPSTCATCGGTRIITVLIDGPEHQAWDPCPHCTSKAAPSGAVSEELSPSHKELIETLNDIEAFFRKEYAYEVENMGSGGSQIAAGRWKRYFMALYNLTHDLPELIRNQQRRPTEEMQRALLAGRAALLREEDDFREEYTAHRNAVSKERADECAAHAATLEAIAGKL